MSPYDYIVMVALIVLVIYITIFLKVKQKKYAFFTGVIFIIFGLIACRLLWACYDPEIRFRPEYLFRLEFGSMDLGGAFLVFPIVLVIVNKLFKINYKDLFEVMIEALILTSAIGKIACFSIGCCRGIPTDLPWAVNGLHPVQLYETGIWIIVYIVVMLTKNRMNNINRVCVITIFCILLRMPIETLRADAELFVKGGYWIAYKILIAIAIIVLYINNRKNIKKSLIAFSILVVLLLVGIELTQKNKYDAVDNMVENQIEDTSNYKNKGTPDKFIEVQADGTIINTSSELNKTKEIDGLEISNIRLKKVENTVTLEANIKNTSTEKKGGYLIDIFLINNTGKKIDKLVGYIDEVEPDKSVELSASGVIVLFDYIYDLKFML